MGAIGRLGWIQVDCRDPVALATFWGTMLGMELDESLGETPHYQGLVPVTASHPVVSLKRVPEQKGVKNRLHFDVAVEDVEAATFRNHPADVTVRAARRALTHRRKAALSWANARTDVDAVTIWM